MQRDKRWSDRSRATARDVVSYRCTFRKTGRKTEILKQTHSIYTDKTYKTVDDEKVFCNVFS